jgi:hypothetical protein
MNTKETIEKRKGLCCPRCRSKDISTMATLKEIVSSGSNEFASDLADWLSPPKRPKRPVSRRHRTGLRNSAAFSIVWILIFTAGYYALAGHLPGVTFLSIVSASALIMGFTTWRTESRLATKEDQLLMGAHWERHRAFLHRRRVWARLIYCRKCALVVDPVTRDSNTIYHVHELANSKVKSVSRR